ncbi:unnamed protein product, partial [Ectocarpus sp. 12 AP-2014]
IWCKEWRFNWKAYWHWRKVRSRPEGTDRQAQSELPSYSTFGGKGATTSSLQGVEEHKQSLTGLDLVTTSAEQDESAPTAMSSPLDPETA